MTELENRVTELGQPEFEIVIVPNGLPPHHSYIPSSLSSRIRLLPRIATPGKGSAIKEGFREARGMQVFMIDADLPYELDFVPKALELADHGADLVYANRRHPESYFRVKIPTLHLAFRRHCFGLLFNKLARLFLGVQSKDTQAGMKLLSRRLAKAVSQFSTCPGFLFDLEIFILAQINAWKVRDLPVVFNLENEKSSVRLFKETVAILTWLPKIRWNTVTGRYSPRLAKNLEIQPQ